MLSPAHFAVGGAIAARMPRAVRWLAVPAAIGSHYVLDAIPHFEHSRLLGLVADVPRATVYWSWRIPWGLVFAGAIAWLLYRAVKGRQWKWWAFVALCGLLAAAPDIPGRTMAEDHALRRFHDAMHAHHDWATSLQQTMAGEPTWKAIEHDRVSGWFYAGIAAEVIVETLLFALGMMVVSNADRESDKSNHVRAGPTGGKEE